MQNLNDESINQSVTNEKVILPFDYADDEHYYVEKIVIVPKKPIYSFFKRLFDICFSAMALILLFLPIIVISIGVKATSKGPVFYKQERLGLNGKKFNIIKFRTMRIDAEKDGAQWSMGDEDERITKFGRMLRKTRLDELPQFWCCLIGTMSIIGYRPLVLTEEKCNAMRNEMNVFSMRPGISGFAQINGRDEVYYKNKAIMDAEYVKNASLIFDIKLFFVSIGAVVKDALNIKTK